MPARAKQSLFIMNHKDNKKRPTIIAIQKTGYVNVWINGTHYYKSQNNQKQSYSSLNNVNWQKAMTPNYQSATKKQTIVIMKKRR